ncbi:TonB-dependent receptor [Pseudomonas qingdaonensis]|nr:TonB-dependent receptor [Pseudomonas qingdaonensis]
MTPEYRINDNLRVFFRYAHGFRSGGFNTGLSSNLAQLTTVDPEQLDAYELGLKSEWFDHRLTVNANLFYYDYQDIQVNLLTVNSGVLTTALTNGAKGKVKGAELEIEASPPTTCTCARRCRSWTPSTPTSRTSTPPPAR